MKAFLLVILLFKSVLANEVAPFLSSAKFHNDQIGITYYEERNLSFLGKSADFNRSQKQYNMMFVICTSEYRDIRDCDSFSLLKREFSYYTDSGEMIGVKEESFPLPISSPDQLLGDILAYMELNNDHLNSEIRIDEINRKKEAKEYEPDFLSPEYFFFLFSTPVILLIERDQNKRVQMIVDEFRKIIPALVNPDLRGKLYKYEKKLDVPYFFFDLDETFDEFIENGF